MTLPQLLDCGLLVGHMRIHLLAEVPSDAYGQNRKGKAYDGSCDHHDCFCRSRFGALCGYPMGHHCPDG